MTQGFYRKDGIPELLGDGYTIVIWQVNFAVWTEHLPRCQPLFDATLTEDMITRQVDWILRVFQADWTWLQTISVIQSTQLNPSSQATGLKSLLLQLRLKKPKEGTWVSLARLSRSGKRIRRQVVFIHPAFTMMNTKLPYTRKLLVHKSKNKIPGYSIEHPTGRELIATVQCEPCTGICKHPPKLGPKVN